MSYRREPEKDICYKNQGNICCGECNVPYYSPAKNSYNLHMFYQPTQREIKDMILYDRAEGNNYDPAFVATRAMIKGQQPSMYIVGTGEDNTGISFNTAEGIEPEVVEKDKNEIRQEIAKLQQKPVEQDEANVTRERITIMMRQRVERKIFVRRERELKVKQRADSEVEDA
ncbi:hypothetical protein JXA85_07070 [Candidatus Woesearchaeota archaeon]|nr:hypothetical protein [Candidatus Woesearchaeota archaeon]